MADFGYHTDEYVTENEIDNFLKCLQLEWLIKEHQAVRKFIRSILIDNLPVPNRTIKVTTIGEIPASVGQLPLISEINRTKEFGCRIAYQRDERFSVPNKTISQMLFGDHFAQAGYNDSAKEFVICIQFNKFNEDVIKAQAQNYNQINKETIQKVFAEHMRTDKVTQGSDSTIAHQSQMHNPESTSADDSKGRVPMEEILSQLKALGVDSSWIKAFTEYASANGFKESLPNPKIEGVDNRVCLRFGKIAGHLPSDPSKLKLSFAGPEMEWKINQYGGFFYIPTAIANGIKDDAFAVQDYINDLNTPHTAQPQKENRVDNNQNKTILDLDSIATKATEMGATPFWSDLFRLIATEKGFGNGPQKVVFANYPDCVVVGMGEFADDDYEPEVKRFKALDREMTYTTFSDGIVFTIPIKNEEKMNEQKEETSVNKEEAKMSNEQNPTDADLVWKKLRQQLEAAKLSQQSIDGIMHTLRHDAGLKKPTEESVLLCTKGRNVTNVYYSHAGKPVTLTDVEQAHTFDDGETLSYSAGHRDAFFIADTTNVKTFEEKMIHQHLGVPKVKLELSSGYSVDLPFKKTYEAVTRDQVLVRITCDALVSVSAKVLESLTGPALTDLQGTQADRYFIRGNQLTKKVFHKRAALGAGSWPDIEKA